MARIGWQQLIILRRARDSPGLSSTKICKGLNITNYPHKRLENRGLLRHEEVKHNNTVHHEWYITDEGREKLETNEWMMPQVAETMRQRGIAW